ncbi:hypothetical protein ACM46_15010 [Chryseobacterium angstadtii]|uniref:Lipoprotein n=1 Tax=Chryseobacterium angstadtii TaxID=558151 RepID=A0A0J7I5Y4_9FLAO|nr:hypothetical protein [Chryseobacterium angstadtii]KMQ61344.1 hypothetical protein ACM46_15010 [Chryseobacterium angstadtii]
MKRIILLIFLANFLLSCKSQLDRKDAEYILDTALEVSSKNRIKYNFIILTSMNVRDTAFYKNGKFGIGITIMDSKVTDGLNYKKIYSYKGIPIVSKDSLRIFNSLLTPIPYQNLNENSIKGLHYDPFNITLIFDKKSKLLHTFPENYENYFKKFNKN